MDNAFCYCPVCDRRITRRAAGAVSHFRAHVRRKELQEVDWTPDGLEYQIPGKTRAFGVGYGAAKLINDGGQGRYETLEESKARWWATHGIAE